MTELPTRLFEAATVSDLQLPLQTAFAAAAAERIPLKFRLKLKAGRYEGLNLALDDLHDRSELILIVECEEGVATLTGGLNLRAGRVLLRNIVLTGIGKESPSLEVRVAHQFLAQGVALVGNVRHDGGSPDPLVRLALAYGSGTARAVFRQCWFVGNRAEGSAALIETPKIGPGTFEFVDFEDVVFAHNAVDVAIAPWFSAAVNLVRCFAYEDQLTEAFLRLPSPLPTVRLEGGVLATGRRLARFVTSVDVARADFGPLHVGGSALYLSESQDGAADLVLSQGATIAKGLPPLDPDDLAAQAATLTVPNAEQLGQRLG